MNNTNPTRTFRPNNTSLVIHAREHVGPRGVLFIATAFAGRSTKPVLNLGYPTAERREKDVARLIETYRAKQATKAGRKAARVAFKHDLAAGDILQRSWGYEQTNVDFYVVQSVRGAVIEYAKCGKQTVETNGSSDRVVAVPDSITGETKKGRPGRYGVKVNSYDHASKWDGKPCYQTASGYGH